MDFSAVVSGAKKTGGFSCGAVQSLTIEVKFCDYAHDPRDRETVKALKYQVTQGRVVGKSNSSRKRDQTANERSARALITTPKRKRVGLVESAPPDVSLTLKHFNRRIEKSVGIGEGKRLFLRVGDEVNHQCYEEWGIGVVMEVMTSSVPGGTCLARVRFQDGQLRCFNNDLDNEACCYYFGVRRYWNSSHGVEAIRSKLFF